MDDRTAGCFLLDGNDTTAIHGGIDLRAAANAVGQYETDAKHRRILIIRPRFSVGNLRAARLS